MKSSRWTPVLISLAVVAFATLPLLWLLRLSLTPEIEIHRWPPLLLPSVYTSGHYSEVLQDGRFWIQLFNALAICTLATVAALSLGAFGAFGLARYRFRSRDALLIGCLALHLVPGMANMAAVYRAAEFLHAFDSLLFVALIKAGGVTLALWVLTATFKNVPEQLELSAQLDGLTARQSLLRITLPLAGPGLLTAGMLLFIQAWNTFFLPFLLLEDPDKMTLTVGLYRYFSEHGFARGHVAAFMVLTLLPVLVVFFVFRRRLWRNIEV